MDFLLPYDFVAIQNLFSAAFSTHVHHNNSFISVSLFFFVEERLNIVFFLFP